MLLPLADRKRRAPNNRISCFFRTYGLTHPPPPPAGNPGSNVDLHSLAARNHGLVTHFQKFRFVPGFHR